MKKHMESIIYPKLLIVAYFWYLEPLKNVQPWNLDQMEITDAGLIVAGSSDQLKQRLKDPKIGITPDDQLIADIIIELEAIETILLDKALLLVPISNLDRETKFVFGESPRLPQFNNAPKMPLFVETAAMSFGGQQW